MIDPELAMAQGYGSPKGEVLSLSPHLSDDDYNDADVKVLQPVLDSECQIPIKKCDDPGEVLDLTSGKVSHKTVNLQHDAAPGQFRVSQLAGHWQELQNAVDNVSQLGNQVYFEINNGLLSPQNRDFALDLKNAGEKMVAIGQSLCSRGDSFLEQLASQEAKLQSVPKKESNKKWMCYLCKVFHKTKGDMQACFVSHEKVIMCGICNCSFANEKDMSDHLEVHHTGPFVCDRCEMELLSPDELEIHMKSHNVGKHMCTICSRSYSTKYLLQNHLKGHSDETYQCSFCEQTLPTPGAKRQHESRVHKTDPRRMQKLGKK